MRLWHYKLIPFLPKSQLLAQWRELNSIFKKQDRHILINYIYKYPKEHLYSYSVMVINEMKNRNYNIKSLSNFHNYFGKPVSKYYLLEPFPAHHDNRYLKQCFYNLQEKYDRGQKDFTRDQYWRLLTYIRGFDFGNDI